MMAELGRSLTLWRSTGNCRSSSCDRLISQVRTLVLSLMGRDQIELTWVNRLSCICHETECAFGLGFIVMPEVGSASVSSSSCYTLID